MVSFGVELSLCGFGWEGGLFPNVRLGVAMFWWCRGSMRSRLVYLVSTLRDARDELAKRQP